MYKWKDQGVHKQNKQDEPRPNPRSKHEVHATHTQVIVCPSVGQATGAV